MLRMISSTSWSRSERRAHPLTSERDELPLNSVSLDFFSLGV